ncbi:aspartate aminotransferase, chloroplastic [Tanacetum coccineum]
MKMGKDLAIGLKWYLISWKSHDNHSIGNHKNIFNDARVPWSEYRYYDPKTVDLDFEGMIKDIKGAPEGSFIPLHGCAHNLTGIDPTPKQWEKIADVIQEKNHIPFFDVAYQGFASGSIDEDASSVRLSAARGMELSCAQSYGKNLGLYAERVGAINVLCSPAEAAVRYVSHSSLKQSGMFSFTGLNKAQIERDEKMDDNTETEHYKVNPCDFFIPT